MTKLDTAIRKTASLLIQKHGQMVEIARKVQDYLPAAGEMVVEEFHWKSVRAMVSEFRVGYQSNTTVQSGDMKVTIAAADLDYDPEPGDTVKIGESVYTVVPPVQPTYINEQVGIWDLQVRK